MDLFLEIALKYIPNFAAVAYKKVGNPISPTLAYMDQYAMTAALGHRVKVF